MMYNIDDYQQEAGELAVYPEVNTGSHAALAYCALGLAGEAGEVADKVKKILRGDKPLDSTVIDAIAKEVGDTLWYACRLLAEFGIPASEALKDNLHKLHARREAGTLKGSGDER